jgi:polyisoprenoid-binding protein YceI
MSAETTTTLPNGVYSIDTLHSSISFKTRHGVATFRAGFAGITGSLENGVLSGQVPVDGVILPSDLFKEHLVGPAWFDAANHPDISWRSTSITADGDQLKFEGELTLKGVTKAITGTGVVHGPGVVYGPNGERTTLGIDITTEISAPEFGVGEHGLGETTTIEISLELE